MNEENKLKRTLEIKKGTQALFCFEAKQWRECYVRATNGLTKKLYRQSVRELEGSIGKLGEEYQKSNPPTEFATWWLGHTYTFNEAKTFVADSSDIVAGTCPLSVSLGGGFRIRFPFFAQIVGNEEYEQWNVLVKEETYPMFKEGRLPVNGAAWFVYEDDISGLTPRAERLRRWKRIERENGGWRFEGVYDEWEKSVCLDELDNTLLENLAYRLNKVFPKRTDGKDTSLSFLGLDERQREWFEKRLTQGVKRQKHDTT